MRETVLLKDITTIGGYHLTDHMWLSDSTLFRKFELKAGDTVQFVALAEEYRRKRTGELDYRLSTLTRLRKV